MNSLRYIYWQDGDMWLGYLEDFPDYMTQGKTLEELQDNLKDIYREVSSGNIPAVRHVAELQLA
jgi:predicted RNase H-like HicB family nuclease